MFVFGCAWPSPLLGLVSVPGRLITVAALRSTGLGTWASVAGPPGRQSTDPVVVVHRLCCSVAGRILPNQYQTHVSCLDRWILYHRASTETPDRHFFKKRNCVHIEEKKRCRCTEILLEHTIIPYIFPTGDRIIQS